MTETTFSEEVADQMRVAGLIESIAEIATASAANQFSTEDLEVRLDLLENYWESFRDRDLILQRVKGANKESTYFTKNTYGQVVAKYLKGKAAFRALLNPTPRSRSDGSTGAAGMPSTSSLQASLEKVQLPRFDGNQRSWEPFKEKFQSLVGSDATMPPVIKLQRLFNCLEGEAAEKLSGIQPIGANFDTAWETLCRRYDNKYLRFSIQMQALMSLPTAAKENVTHLNQLLNTVSESINVFKTLKRPVEKWDDVLIFFVESKLAPSTRIDWAKEVERKELADFPTYSLIKTFVEDRIRTLDVVDAEAATSTAAAGPSKTAQDSSVKKTGQSNRHRSNAYSATTKKGTRAKSKCSFCGEEHFIGYCAQFAQKSVEHRREHIAKNNLCFNCFSSQHEVSNCTSKGRCLACNGKHHTKLHTDRSAAVNVATAQDRMTANSDSRDSTSSGSGEASAHLARGGPQILLPTACILLVGPDGHAMSARALLDPGAEESFVTESVAQALGLRKQPTDVAISGVGGSVTAVAKGRVQLTVKSSQCPDFALNFSALVLRRLTAAIPRVGVQSVPNLDLQDLPLADPFYGKPGRIDCVLSAEIYAAALKKGLKQGPAGSPVAVQTVFGWIVMGRTNAEATERYEEGKVGIHHVCVDHELTRALERFWESEEIPVKVPRNTEEEACLRHFNETCRRDEDGRFIVRMPFRKKPIMGETRPVAAASLGRLECRFKRQTSLAEKYCAFMQDYRSMGHMERVSADERDNPSAVYLTHHPVIKFHASGGADAAIIEKIRVVFHASLKHGDKESLNWFLHTGPNLQEEIFTVLLRWAFFPVVFTCDVVKMFRQFMMHPADRDWQRILWRDSCDEPVETYRLSTVTYGTACAPFLANACMLRLAEEENDRFPQGAHVIRKNRYADDFLAGGDTVEEAKIVRDQLTGVLASAGMQVSKWSASNRALLEEEEASEDKEFEVADTVSALGLRWQASSDQFRYKVARLENHEKTTKRTILSDIAKLFDPLGWLAPVVVRPKILLQNLWMQGASWDEAVPPEINTAWRDFRDQLTELEEIKISRWLGTQRSSSWELHCFCDASERAYAAATYIVVNTAGARSPKLIAAKSKVAPVKVVSLPKLELCGASLGIRVVAHILGKVEKQPSAIHCWTDSKVVLAWLKGHPSRWKAYVGNRVSEILTLVPTASWRHVASKDNPADLATRGITAAQLKETAIWWSGPDWLRKAAAEWPGLAEDPQHTDLEARRSGTLHGFTTTADPSMGAWLIEHSSVDKIVRVLAYVQRWRGNAKLPRSQRRITWLSAAELGQGRIWLLKGVQREAYPNELQRLEEEKAVQSSSAIRRLSPFLDKDGLLRVGGRLQNSYLTEEEKHPVILPSQHHVAKLLIQKAHRVTLHGGPQLVQSSLLRQYWLVRGRNAIRGIIRRCVTCARHKAATIEQQMAPLPEARTRPARPFTLTGVDYAGPFFIKSSPGRGQKAYKGYVAIFVCLVVKAVHIEIVSDYTSAAFLAAFRRFTARRGLCKILFSDNGTTFQGADAELRRLFGETSAVNQEIAAAIARDGVEWSFIPPRAPNFGGLWEANVKAFKNHFRRVVGDRRLTFEEFSTIAAMVEACLNSRPLSALSSSEEDIAALTPAHFLIGAPMIAPPEPFDTINQPNSVYTRWQVMAPMRNHFWKRWRDEFLRNLQQRSKWLHPNHSFKVGDIVLFKDTLQPPTKWPLARIVRLYPGRDGLSRVALIKTADSEYKRPINKLILLPVNEEASSHLVRVSVSTAGGVSPPGTAR